MVPIRCRWARNDLTTCGADLARGRGPNLSEGVVGHRDGGAVLNRLPAGELPGRSIDGLNRPVASGVCLGLEEALIRRVGEGARQRSGAPTAVDDIARRHRLRHQIPGAADP